MRACVEEERPFAMFARIARAIRPIAILAVAATALAACSGEKGGSTADGNAKVDAYLAPVIMGDPNAKVTMVEYASFTCPHCRDFWKQVFPRIKSTYIDTGKMTYELRNFPTPPVEVAMAAAAIARCKGKDAYYDIVDDFVTSYHDLITAVQSPTGAGPVLVAVGGRHGLSPEEVQACVNNEKVNTYLQGVVRDVQDKVNSTPTVFIRGPGDTEDTVVPEHTFEAISAIIEAKLNPGAAPAAPAATETPVTPPAQ
jgi:protein-disulfide isomerase